VKIATVRRVPMGENPIQKALREAHEQDARRQEQVQNQRDAIDRLMHAGGEVTAIQAVLDDLDAAVDFIARHGLIDDYRAEVRATGKDQPQDKPKK
jgi:F0F1-type ATP synthase membrane subunit b/b'